MKEIGGYFELELNQGSEYHNNAIRLNSGRNAFEYILRSRKYKKVYLPYYTCDVMLEPVKKLKIEYSYYNINNQLEPLFEFQSLKADQAFVYTNYFGIKGAYSQELSGVCSNLIIDNSQAFFDKPISGIDTFNSPRKFFGLPDGAYLFTNKSLNAKIPIDNSTKRFSHLLKRIDEGAKEGFNDFKTNDKSLSGQPIKLMSKLTKALLSNIDYEKSKKRRKENFQFLNDNLFKSNKIKLESENNYVPMVYPYWPNGGNALRYELIKNNVFVAKYWPNINACLKPGSIEINLIKHLIPLPIDQRYGLREMDFILKLIRKFYA